MSFFTYLNTYNNSSSHPGLSLADFSSNYRVSSDISCSVIASENLSRLFILTDYNDNQRDASCLYAPITSSMTTRFTDASYSDWISGLSVCNTTNSDTSCNIISDTTTFGNRTNISIYTTPSLLMKIPSSANADLPSVIDINEFKRHMFNLDVNNPASDIVAYITAQRTYLQYFYLDISSVNSSGVYVYTPGNESTVESARKQATIQRGKVQEHIFEINKMFNAVLINLEELNRQLSIRYKLVEILNLKIFYAQQFFNILMNKNQGAIGELDISNYNRILIIFQNIIVSIIIFYSIYLYFKKD